MTTHAIHQALDELPADLQRQVADFILFLKQRQQQPQPSAPTPGLEEIAAARRAGFGAMRGQIWMSDDFDEPLEDFKEYM